MTDMSCADVRDMAAEVALGIASAEERDSALEHVRACPSCHRLVSELSTVGDGLLVLAPAREPPAGFESRVLAAMHQASSPSRVKSRLVPRPWLKFGYAAAIVVVAALGSLSVYLATATDRQLGESYRETLRIAGGSSFDAVALEGPEGRVGTVFAYEGDPSWLMVTIDRPLDGEIYRVEARTRAGGYVEFGSADFGEDSRFWGAEIPVDPSDIVQIRFMRPGGGTAFLAQVDPSRPWGS